MRMTAALTLAQIDELMNVLADQVKKADAERGSHNRRIAVSIWDDEPVINVASFMQVYGKNLSVLFTELVDE